MIIDSHVHLCEPPHSQDKLKNKMADEKILELDVMQTDVSVGCLLRDMDACEIDRALVMAFSDWISNESLSLPIRLTQVSSLWQDHTYAGFPKNFAEVSAAVPR